MNAPSGLVTLAFTDIEGSSEMSERYQAAFEPLRIDHYRILRDSAAHWDGFEVSTAGDSIFFAFQSAAAAVSWAVEAQRAIGSKLWRIQPTDSSREPEAVNLKVRIGMHSGEAYASEEGGRPNYHGPVPNRASRVESAGHGGQILISEATRLLVSTELPEPLSFKDCGVHRLKGVGEERLWQVAHPELPADFPPLRTLTSLRHNLPAPLTSFVGRESELSVWSELLSNSSTRLLTLTGPGGVGKTRCALQLADLSADRVSGGVWWIPLETALNGNEVIERLAAALSLELQPQPSGKEQLLTFLREQQLILFLDNTEQIPDIGRVINELLIAAPILKCVVTSRRALEIQGERLVEVSPLPSENALALFLDRVRARRADFELTRENEADVAALCDRLEGIPLALELAASRVAALTPHDILTRLKERFRILQTRAPDLSPRQSALKGAIDWSYELLDEESRQLFAQLSVFAGEFTVAAAEEVCEAFDALEGVVDLRRNSLLRAGADPSGREARYAMLDSIREYAAEKLNGIPELASAVRDRHAEFYLQYAESRAALLRTQEEQTALDDLEIESGNLNAALQHAASSGAGETCARLAIVLYQYLYRRGFWEQALAALRAGQEAIQKIEGANGPRAGIYHGLAALMLDRGEIDAANDLAIQALDQRRIMGNPIEIAESLNLIGLVEDSRGDPDAARSCFAESLSLLPTGLHSGRSIALNNLARLAAQASDLEQARTLYEEALKESRAAGDRRGEAETLGNLGALAHAANDPTGARVLYQKSLALSRELHEHYCTAAMLNNLGELAQDQGHLEEAIPYLIHARRLLHDLGSADEAEPAKRLGDLSGLLPPARFEELTQSAQKVHWEDLVDD